jgi:hypothetical protein
MEDDNDSNDSNDERSELLSEPRDDEEIDNGLASKDVETLAQAGLVNTTENGAGGDNIADPDPKMSKRPVRKHQQPASGSFPYLIQVPSGLGSHDLES